MNIFSLFKKAARYLSDIPPEYIIVGLGNAGKKYEYTRHNAGFLAIDCLAKSLNCNIRDSKFKSFVAWCRIADKRCLLMKPATFMNLSGQAVAEAMQYFKIPPEKVIIIFDDFSLPIGTIRIRRDGSGGGHNGMKNIISLLSSHEFPRIKIGVGDETRQNSNSSDFVLAEFTSKDKELLDIVFARIIKSVELMVSGQINQAMNLYNGDTLAR